MAIYRMYIKYMISDLHFWLKKTFSFSTKIIFWYQKIIFKTFSEILKKLLFSVKSLNWNTIRYSLPMATSKYITLSPAILHSVTNVVPKGLPSQWGPRKQTLCGIYESTYRVVRDMGLGAEGSKPIRYRSDTFVSDRYLISNRYRSVGICFSLYTCSPLASLGSSSTMTLIPWYVTPDSVMPSVTNVTRALWLATTELLEVQSGPQKVP